jgi:membrane protein implicated in regulation of membrane protease activity
MNNKKRTRPPLRIIIRYFLLQLPGQAAFVLMLLLLRRYVTIPVHLVWILIGLWVGKDIFLFPFLWRFYDPDLYPDRFKMAGHKGVALTRLEPDGYVQVRGERWQASVAEGQAPIAPGEKICVEAIDGLKLTVRARER